MTKLTEEEGSILRKCKLLSELSDQDCEAFLEISSIKSFEKNSVILEEGVVSDELYILFSGSIGLFKKKDSLYVPLSHGKIGIGETIGEMRIIHDKPSTLKMAANEPVKVLCVSMMKLRSTPYFESLLKGIIKILNDRLDSTNYTALIEAHEKKKKRTYFIFASLGMVVLFLFLSEAVAALYFTLNSEELCNKVYTSPPQNLLPH